MNSFQVLTKKLNEDHKNRLDWFMYNKNKEIKGWPKPLDNQLLLCRPKGIYKPKEMEYALSIRTSINGPYDDKLIEHSDGKFEFSYFQENLNLWDVAAGIILVKEAGGFLNSINLSKKENLDIRAASSSISEKILEKLDKF